MNKPFLYISQGKLFYKKPENKHTEIESDFAKAAIEKSLEIDQRNAWKQKSMMQSMGLPQAMIDQEEPRVVNIRITAVSHSKDNSQFFYALDSNGVGGLFKYNLESNKEKRLFHKNEFLATDLDQHQTKDLLICSRPNEKGNTNIALMNSDGSNLHDITEGDSIDEAASWISKDKKEFIYQSAGIGRSEEGIFVATGPYSLELMDLENNRHKTLMEDDEFDYLCPHVDNQSNLYYIKRPYSDKQKKANILTSLKDLILMPFRILWALISFLNFFSIMFTRKPLITQNTKQQHSPTTGSLFLWGRMIEAEESIKKSSDGSIVPESWQLIKQNHNGKEEVLATSVLSFDLCENNSIIYTNGSKVYLIDSNNKKEVIHNDKLIEKIAFIK